MRIRQLDLIRYGKFADETLALPRASNDFHVLVGPNEAGKSTVRTAVTELLFGMKLKTPLGFLHGTPELRLGGVLENDGGELAFHRARGRASLRTPDDQPLSEHLLASFLAGASEDFFEQMFGLDHARLLQGGKSILDASDRLGQVLFESAAGVGRLSAVRESLDARMLELWAPRREKTEYAVAEAALARASGEVKEALVRPRDWSSRNDEVEQIEREIEQARAEQARLETLRTKLERVRRLAPVLNSLRAKQAARESLASGVELPASASSELNEARGLIAAARERLKERIAVHELRSKARQALEADSEVLALGVDIEALDRLRGACINHPRDLPLREAEVARELGRVAESAAQLGWPSDEAGQRAALPKALTLRTVVHLRSEHASIEQTLANAEEAVRERERDQADLRAQIDALTVIELPASLAAARPAAQAFRNSDAIERSLEAKRAAAEQTLNEALDRLGRWRRPVDELRTMELPPGQRIAALQRKTDELELALSAARQSVLEARERLEAQVIDERHFGESNKVVTRAEILAARQLRDDAWRSIRTGTLDPSSGALALENAIRLADELADAHAVSSTAAATLQTLRQQIEAQRKTLEQRDARRQACESALAALTNEWSVVARDAGLEGMPLSSHADWLGKRDAALAARMILESHARALDETRTARVSAQQALLNALQDIAPLAARFDASKGLDWLLAAADAVVADAARAAAMRDSLDTQIAQAARALESAKSRAATALAANDQWTKKWRDALEETHLSAAGTTPAAAEGAVELATAIATSFKALESPRERVAAMRADLSTLVAEGRRIGAMLEHPIAEPVDGFAIARQLMTRLIDARQTAQEIEQADIALRASSNSTDEAHEALAAIQARIRPIIESAGVDSIEAALPLAERSDQARSLATDIALAIDALHRDGDGLAPEKIFEEVADTQIDQLPASLATVKQEVAAIGGRLNGLMERQVLARQSLDAVHGQANAALAEARRQEAVASMGEAAEQYLEAATASRLLKWAIDRYRDQKQGPMLRRAGEIFNTLTLGEFTKLSVDTEVAPPRLQARRANGSPPIEVAGLSEGTRDQLFLALRIAALELQLRAGTALPFIADDLFINFDDERAAAGLAALRDLSSKTQVLFLTHHDHLLPMIREVCGGEVNVVRLQR